MGEFSLGSIVKLSWDFQGEYYERFIIDFHGFVELCRGVVNHSAMK